MENRWEAEEKSHANDDVFRFPVVAIGASAGGVEALSSFFRHLPPRPDAAFIVITHLAPHQKSLLPEILGRCTTMPVAEAGAGQEITPGAVSVIPPGTVLTIDEGRLTLVPRGEEHNVIDQCLASLAAEVKERAVAIILSGTGADGAIGLKAVRAAGGFTLAQGPDGAGPSYRDMPEAAIATGFVDCVLPVEALAERVACYLDDASRGSWVDVAGADHDARLRLQHIRRELCRKLQNRVGHDFSGYKEKTFLRRVERRMQVRHIAHPQGYLQLVEDEPEEINALFRDLLIGVTEFFRDAASFDVLGEQVVPKLIEGKGPDDVIRIWVPGCATGEEAYSIAIVLLERFDRRQQQPRLQIFATDVDERAVSVARLGRYPARLLDGLASDRLNRFFRQDGGSYVVAKELRDSCIFSSHSLIRDPPFSRIDLVSCRNLLIYLDTDLQSQVLSLFHYALRPGGYLFLGASEHVSQHTHLFAPLDKKHRIFQRRDLSCRPPLNPAAFRLSVTGPSVPSGEDGRPHSAAQEAVRRFGAMVLDRYAPAHVVVNGEWEVLHYSARTGRYLEPPAGSPSRNLLALARTGLRLPLRSALQEAAQSHRRCVREQVAVDGETGMQIIDLSVEPLPNAAEPFWLVVFTDICTVPRRDETVGDAGQGSDQRDELFHVEQELRQTREQLQTSIEEYQATVEELKSSNEEMLSVNEELQSSNEELETAKEELQSVNEELHTVNSELSRKVDELDRSHSDLKNLFDSTQIATVFLDRNLIIRSFTPAVAEIFKLIPGDCGRPLSDIVSDLDYDDLSVDVAAALASLEPLEKRLITRDDSAHYLMRVLPYRTIDGQVDGVVITFVNVTHLVRLGEQKALVAELNHRVKNILAVVSAMAVQMARRDGTKEEFAQALSSRISGIAKTHDILSRNQWTPVGLRELMLAELSAFIDDLGRAHLEGPEMHLTPKAATALGIVIHELATNALKYGAFSRPQGYLEVTWREEEVSGVRRLVLRWQEFGGPPVRPPERKGFGTDVIERSLDYEFGGSTVLDFRGEGLVATFTMPTEEILAKECSHAK